ncbi:MAG: hypothetical protein ACFFG0_03815 [Candidatus Thorarchaeota archaeon]
MSEKECYGCNFPNSCIVKSKNCMCKTCLVKIICYNFCYERHLHEARGLKLEPLSREHYTQIFGAKNV